MDKAARQILTLYLRLLDDRKVSEPFTYWTRLFLIKKWERRWTTWRSCFFLAAHHSCYPAAMPAWLTGTGPTAQSATVHSDYWFPQGLSASVLFFPSTAFSFLFFFLPTLAAWQSLCVLPSVLTAPCKFQLVSACFRPSFFWTCIFVTKAT